MTNAPGIGDTVRHPDHRSGGKVLERVTLYGNPELVDILVEFKTGQRWLPATACRVVKRARKKQ